MDTEFGLSTDDKQILDRLKSNREKNNIEKDIAKKQKKAAKEQSKVIQVDGNQLPVSVSEVDADTNDPFPVKISSYHRGTTTPEISFDDYGSATYIWARHYIKKNQVLIIPKAIELDGMLELTYNPVSKVLVIKAQESKDGANLVSPEAL